MNRFIRNNFWLIIILIVAFGLRVYNADQYFIFEHDQDLFSWVVKDMVDNKHLRLIGQLTSIEGLFIGPLFYYSLVPFFLLFNMDPIGALIPAILVELFTVASFYWVFSRVINKNVGLIASFIYTISTGVIFYGKWVVPTLPVVLWSLWFFYCLYLITQKKKMLWLLGILSGLIWHIHIALLPLLILPVILILLYKNKVLVKDFLLSVLFFIGLVSPFLIFEFKHGFIQTLGVINSLGLERGEVAGIDRLIKILVSITALFRGMFITINFMINKFAAGLFILGWLVVNIMLYKKQIVKKEMGFIFILWLIVVFSSQQFTKRPISEYYFLSLLPFFILTISLVVNVLFSYKKMLAIGILIIFSSYSFWQLINFPVTDRGYIQKKQLVLFIKEDMVKHDLNCVAINYIADFGTAVGFRYFYWLYGLKVIYPNSETTVYNIVIPFDKSAGEIDIKFGSLGIIMPRDYKYTSEEACQDPKYQLIDPLGYVD